MPSRFKTKTKDLRSDEQKADAALRSLKVLHNQKCITDDVNKEILSQICSMYNFSLQIKEKKTYKYKGTDKTHYGPSTVYSGMLRRCYNPKSEGYKDYGDRGIKICDEWLNDRQSFVKWSIENGWNKNLRIDRIDVNGDYCPSNCRYVTNKENCRNMRKTIYAEVDGIIKPFIEWCEILNLKYRYVYPRYIRLEKLSPTEAIKKAIANPKCFHNNKENMPMVN